MGFPDFAEVANAEPRRRTFLTAMFLLRHIFLPRHRSSHGAFTLPEPCLRWRPIEFEKSYILSGREKPFGCVSCSSSITNLVKMKHSNIKRSHNISAKSNIFLLSMSSFITHVVESLSQHFSLSILWFLSSNIF